MAAMAETILFICNALNTDKYINNAGIALSVRRIDPNGDGTVVDQADFHVGAEDSPADLPAECKRKAFAEASI